MNFPFSSDRNGFTLVELMLYTGLTALLLILVSLFLSTILESRIKNQTIAEVEQQGVHVMQVMSQTIRNAEDVTSPTIGTNGDSLTLDVLDASNDPTIFDLHSGTLHITEGSGSPIPLLNDRVSVSNLMFENLARPDTPGLVRISFTLHHNNFANRNEYAFEKTFYASALTRQAYTDFISPGGGGGGAPTCTSYAQTYGYSSGACRQNSIQCLLNGEIYLPGGNPYCTGGPSQDTCCVSF